MRGNEMLDKMELIEPEYIAEAEKEYRSPGFSAIKAAGIAACLLLIVAGVIIGVQFTKSYTSTDIQNPDGAKGEYPPLIIVPDNSLDEQAALNRIVINETESVMDVERKHIPGYFTEKLSEQNTSVLLPDVTSDFDISGFIGFDGDGNVVEAILNVTAPEYPARVVVSVSRFHSSCIYELEAEPEVSVINGMEFIVYRCTVTENEIWLSADAEVNGYSLSLFMETTPDTIAGDQTLFGSVIEFFSSYEEGCPDVSSIKPQNIPEFCDTKLSMEEAQQNVDFGKYMLRCIPDGFIEESIRRYKDQNNNYLSGLWTRGYDELSWIVSHYSDEDAERITDITDTENYDLSLYPIPRADSVPEELYEIVNDPIFIAEELTLEAVRARAYKTGETGDSDGWRMNFSVKFDDILVMIRVKGAEPEWIYNQIISML